MLCHLTPLLIFISPSNRYIKALARDSLKSPHSSKVQKDQFQPEQNTKSVLKGLTSTLTSSHNSLSLASSELVEQVNHHNQRGYQLVHHRYHLKKGYQVYRGKVPLHNYLYGLCCFQHHHHCCHRRHHYFLNH